MLISLIAAAEYFHICGHDAFQRKQEISKVSATFSESSNGIRIKYQLPDYTNDNKICKAAGNSIKWNGKTHTCDAGDIMSEEKKSGLTNTLDEVKNYFKDLLKVHPLASTSINLKNSTDTTISGSISGAENDIHISIFVRPFDNENKQALTAIVQIDQDTSRPIQSVMFVNPKNIPTTTQKADSDDSRFFWTMVHESLHALGISSVLFPKFHNTTSNSPHSINNTYRSGKRNFLITPNAHIFAVNHYDRVNLSINGEKFTSGIELDTYPEASSSHPNIRRYLSDALAGVIVQPSKGKFTRLTDVTLAFLKDSGFFTEVVYSKASPIIYGNPLITEGTRKGEYLSGLPQKTFPFGYFYNRADASDFSTFDFSFRSDVISTKLINVTCDNEYQIPSIEFCKYQSYYNPDRYAAVQNVAETNYMLLKYPSEAMAADKAMIPGNFTSGGKFTCSGDKKSFTINYTQYGDDKVITCTKRDTVQQNYTLKFNGASNEIKNYQFWYKCPDPGHFCRTMEARSTTFTTDPFTRQEPTGAGDAVEDPTPQGGDNGSGNNGSGNNGSGNNGSGNTGSGNNGGGNTGSGNTGSEKNSEGNSDWKFKLTIALIVIAVIVICAIIIGIAIWLRCKKNKENEEEDNKYSYYSSDSI